MADLHNHQPHNNNNNNNDDDGLTYMMGERQL